MAFVVYTFVDDTYLIKTAKFLSDMIEDVVENMQRALDTWGGLICATKGALVWEKTILI